MIDVFIFIFFPNWKASQKFKGSPLCLICQVTFCVKHIAFLPSRSIFAQNEMSFQTRLIAKHFFNKKIRRVAAPFLLNQGNRLQKYPLSFQFHLPQQYNNCRSKKKSEKKARQKYVKLAVCVACKVQLISHFVGYVNYYSQDLSVLFRIPNARTF